MWFASNATYILFSDPPTPTPTENNKKSLSAHKFQSETTPKWMRSVCSFIHHSSICACCSRCDYAHVIVCVITVVCFGGDVWWSVCDWYKLNAKGKSYGPFAIHGGGCFMHINALELRFGPRSRMFVGSKMKLVQQMFVQVKLFCIVYGHYFIA